MAWPSWSLSFPDTDRRPVHEVCTGSLAGCATQRHFLEVARGEVSRARRYGGSLSVLILDLDYFKQVNDSHGNTHGG